jgi:hypothetical protein
MSIKPVSIEIELDERETGPSKEAARLALTAAISAVLPDTRVHVRFGHSGIGVYFHYANEHLTHKDSRREHGAVYDTVVEIIDLVLDKLQERP